MVKAINDKLESPIKMGSAIVVVLVGIAIIGGLFIGVIKMTITRSVDMPLDNAKHITEIEKNMAVQQECITTLKNDMIEVRDGQKEMQRDIKDILKAVR